MACSQITFSFSKNALLWRPLEEAYLVLRMTDHLGLPLSSVPTICAVCLCSICGHREHHSPRSDSWLRACWWEAGAWRLSSIALGRTLSFFSTVWESRTALLVPPASRVWDVLGVCPVGCYHLHVVVKCVMALRIQWVRSWRYSCGSAGWRAKAPRILGCWGRRMHSICLPGTGLCLKFSVVRVWGCHVYVIFFFLNVKTCHVFPIN